MSNRPFRTSRHALTTMLVLLSCMAMASAQQNQANPDIEVLHVRGPIYVISAGGSNITASIGIDGVLLVDTGPAELSEKVVAAIVDIQKSLQPAVIPSAGGAESVRTRSFCRRRVHLYVQAGQLHSEHERTSGSQRGQYPDG